MGVLLSHPKKIFEEGGVTQVDCLGLLALRRRDIEQALRQFRSTIREVAETVLEADVHGLDVFLVTGFEKIIILQDGTLRLAEAKHLTPQIRAARQAAQRVAHCFSEERGLMVHILGQDELFLSYHIGEGLLVGLAGIEDLDDTRFSRFTTALDAELGAGDGVEPRSFSGRGEKSFLQNLQETLEK